jgi:hypothetical protein
MGILAPTDLRQWPSESEYMPLLRSLADRAARVAINMALLTELFAAPTTPVRLMTDAYKEQRPRAQQAPNVLTRRISLYLCRFPTLPDCLSSRVGDKRGLQASVICAKFCP